MTSLCLQPLLRHSDSQKSETQNKLWSESGASDGVKCFCKSAALQQGLKQKPLAQPGEAQPGLDDKKYYRRRQVTEAGLISYHVERRTLSCLWIVRKVWAEGSTAQVLNHIHIGYFVFAIYTWDRLCSMILSKHWCREYRGWKLRYRNGARNWVCVIQRCHLLLELSCFYS